MEPQGAHRIIAAVRYNGDELKEFAVDVKALSDKAETTHVLFNNNYQDQGQRGAAELKAILSKQRWLTSGLLVFRRSADIDEPAPLTDTDRSLSCLACAVILDAVTCQISDP
jgi:hypothetical protein